MQPYSPLIFNAITSNQLDNSVGIRLVTDSFHTVYSALKDLFTTLSNGGACGS